MTGAAAPADITIPEGRYGEVIDIDDNTAQVDFENPIKGQTTYWVSLGALNHVSFDDKFNPTQPIKAASSSVNSSLVKIFYADGSKEMISKQAWEAYLKEAGAKKIPLGSSSKLSEEDTAQMKKENDENEFEMEPIGGGDSEREQKVRDFGLSENHEPNERMNESHLPPVPGIPMVSPHEVFESKDLGNHILDLYDEYKKTGDPSLLEIIKKYSKHIGVSLNQVARRAERRTLVRPDAFIKAPQRKAELNNEYAICTKATQEQHTDKWRRCVDKLKKKQAQTPGKFFDHKGTDVWIPNKIRCPKCHSKNTEEAPSHGELQHRFQCNDCGEVWQGDWKEEAKGKKQAQRRDPKALEEATKKLTELNAIFEQNGIRSWDPNEKAPSVARIRAEKLQNPQLKKRALALIHECEVFQYGEEASTRQGQWEDGYWKGPLRDGYPDSPKYFDENGGFHYPWEKAEELDKAINKQFTFAPGDRVFVSGEDSLGTVVEGQGTVVEGQGTAEGDVLVKVDSDQETVSCHPNQLRKAQAAAMNPPAQNNYSSTPKQPMQPANPAQPSNPTKAAPPKPTVPPPFGMKYVLDTDNNLWVLVPVNALQTS